ncbi:hypothetical protein [Amycolatopsis sp. cmx-8-4]|uniref:hypothetical protein n=1 Tax=Amycolatopsis sp. cmx-8-4 TaxID=2790947 RepID=UPI003979983D
MEDIASMVAAAGTFVAGYLAQGAKQLGDKVRDGAVDRLYKLIEPRLSKTASGSAALQGLREKPDDPARATMVSAVLADAAKADPEFANQLGQAVRDVYSSQDAAGATVDGNQVTVRQGDRSRFRTRDFVVGDKRTVRISTGGIIMGVVALVAVLGTATAISYNIGGNDGAAEAVQHFESRLFPGSKETTVVGDGGSYHTNRILSTNPNEAVREVYDAIAQDLVPQACGRMRDDVQTAFAADLGFPSCEAAIAALSRQVTSKNDYAESMPSYVNEPPPGGTITINSCDYMIRGGPALGVFSLTRVEGSQWLITGHSAGPVRCASR